MIDPVTSNFVTNMVGISIGGLIAVIAAVSSCFLKSRCTTISTPCMSCDRDVLDSGSDVYKETDSPVTSPPLPRLKI